MFNIVASNFNHRGVTRYFAVVRTFRNGALDVGHGLTSFTDIKIPLWIKKIPHDKKCVDRTSVLIVSYNRTYVLYRRRSWINGKGTKK